MSSIVVQLLVQRGRSDKTRGTPKYTFVCDGWMRDGQMRRAQSFIRFQLYISRTKLDPLTPSLHSSLYPAVFDQHRKYFYQCTAVIYSDGYILITYPKWIETTRKHRYCRVLLGPRYVYTMHTLNTRHNNVDKVGIYRYYVYIKCTCIRTVVWSWCERFQPFYSLYLELVKLVKIEQSIFIVMSYKR